MSDPQNPNPNPNPEQEEPTLEGEVLLLKIVEAIAKGQTGDDLRDLKLKDIEEALKKVMAFRVRGRTLPDGTVECVLDGTVVRIEGATSDIAVGNSAVARARSKAQSGQ